MYWLLVLLLLSSCVSMPRNEQKAHLIAPPSDQTILEKNLQNPLFVTGDWPEEHWWEQFASPELSKLIQEALQNNPSLRAVDEKLQFAKQMSTIARSKLFPLISFDTNSVWEYVSKNGLYPALNPSIARVSNLIDLTLSFTYEFDFWGKNRHLFQAALGRERAEEGETAQAKLLVTTALAQVYFALKTNIAKETLQQRLVSIKTKIGELAALLEKEALFSLLPVLSAEEAREESEKELAAIQEEIAVNQHLLNVLRGRDLDAPLALSTDLEPVPTNIELPEHLFIDLLARRPDLMTAIWRVEALAHEVGAAMTDFFPNIQLKGFNGFESFDFSNLLKGASNTGGLLPAIHLPIFTAGAIRANVRAKKALFEEAVFMYNDLILRSAAEVADNLSFAKSVFTQAHLQNDILVKAERRLELTRMLTLHGLETAFETYLREEELLQKQLEELTLRYHQYTSLIKLTKALGGGVI